MLQRPQTTEKTTMMTCRCGQQNRHVDATATAEKTVIACRNRRHCRQRHRCHRRRLHFLSTSSSEFRSTMDVTTLTPAESSGMIVAALVPQDLHGSPICPCRSAKGRCTGDDIRCNCLWYGGTFTSALADCSEVVCGQRGALAAVCGRRLRAGSATR